MKTLYQYYKTIFLPHLEKSQIREYMLIFVSLLVINSQKTINAYITAQFVDGVIYSNKIFIKRAIIIGLLSFVFVSIAKYFEKIKTAELQEITNLKIRAEILTALESSRLNEINNLTQGDLQQRFLNDVEEMTNIFFVRTFNLLVPFIVTFASLIYFVKINTVVALVASIMCPVLAILFERLRLRMRDLAINVREKETEYRNFQQDIVDGVKTIINYQQVKRFVEKDLFYHGKIKSANLEIAKLRGKGYGAALFLVYFIQIFAIILGFQQLHAKVITAGQLVAIMTLVGNIVAGFSDFGRNLAEMQRSIVSTKKVRELFVENIVLNNPDSNKKNRPKRNDVLVFQNVKFSYSDKSVLTNASFTVKKGEKVLLIGKNGQGKSTIFKLIVGLFQVDAGSITLCGDKVINWLPADDFIFCTNTLKENIFWSDEIKENDEVIFEKMARILHFNYDLEHDLQLHNLSGGEIQKIKIIRCFNKEANLYLLDEPTKALDQKSRASLKKYIKSQFKGKNMLIIDHTDYFKEIVDTVYELEDGKVTLKSTNRHNRIWA